MQRRTLIPVALSFCVLAASLQCNGGRTRPPARTTPKRASDGTPARTTAPAVPAPSGPAIDRQLLVTAQIGPTDRLDARLAALAPPMVPRALLGNLFSKSILTAMARDLGLSPLALDALDLTRPAVVGLLISKHPKPRKVARVNAVAILPIRTTAKMVVDALKVSWPESEIAAWGGVRLVQGGRTLAWVQVRDRWAVLAPTAPLLDSVHRTLPALARGVPEGTVRLRIKYAEILDIVRPAILKGWAQLKQMAQMLGPRLGLTEGLIAQLMPLAEKISAYLDSIRRVELNLRLADAAWGVRVQVTPKRGGKFHTWLKGLQSPKRFGWNLLPAGALMASGDRQSEEMRLLTVKLMAGVVDFIWPKVVSELPRAVKLRGLLDRRRPASLAQYKRTLRDLNLRDYSKSYGIYRLLYDVKALRTHLETRLPRIIKLSTGDVAAALSAPKPTGLSMVTVEGVKNVAQHRKAMYALMFGNQRLLNRIIAGLWRVVPRKVKKRYHLRRAPVQVVFNPVAMRQGRVTVTTMAFRLRWPALPAGKAPHALKELAQIRKGVEVLFGKGDLTYAWAYVGKRMVVAMGRDWRNQMRAMIKRGGRAGAKRPNALTDPLFARTLRLARGTVVSSAVFSGARLVRAVLDGLKAFGVPMPTGGPGALFLQYLRQGATAARLATLFTETREGGTYNLQALIPASDLKTLVVGGAYGFFATRSNHSSSKRPMRLPKTATPPSP